MRVLRGYDVLSCRVRVRAFRSPIKRGVPTYAVYIPTKDIIVVTKWCPETTEFASYLRLMPTSSPLVRSGLAVLIRRQRAVFWVIDYK